MVEIRKYSIKTKKLNLKVIIFTRNLKIVGTIHLPGGRLTDFLNNKEFGEAEFFIPITDAVIHNKNDNEQLYKTKFLGINKNQITLIFPIDEAEIKG